MNPFILSYIITLPAFIAIDLVWLLGPGRPLYVAGMGSLMRASPNMGAALAFYALYAAGLVFFAVAEGVRGASPATAFLQGAGLGLVAYGTYDLTGLAVINGFGTSLALIDLVWGTLLSGSVAWIATKLSLALTG